MRGTCSGTRGIRQCPMKRPVASWSERIPKRHMDDAYHGTVRTGTEDMCAIFSATLPR